MDMTPNVVTQGNDSFINPSDIANSQPQGVGVTPQTQDVGFNQQQQTPPNREAYFQSNWDKLNGYLRNQGIQLDANADYEKVFSPYFQSHQMVQQLDQNPALILELASKMFPNQIVRPSYENQIRDQLIQEFGPEFQPIDSEVYQIGSPSWQYVQRMNQIGTEIKMSELQRQQQEVYQKQVQEQQTRESFQRDLDTAVQEMGIPRETGLEYVKSLSDPNVWSIKNLITLAKIARGELTLTPAQPVQQPIPQQFGQGIPPSPNMIAGGGPRFGPQTLDDWIFGELPT